MKKPWGLNLCRENAPRSKFRLKSSFCGFTAHCFKRLRNHSARQSCCSHHNLCHCGWAWTWSPEEASSQLRLGSTRRQLTGLQAPWHPDSKREVQTLSTSTGGFLFLDPSLTPSISINFPSQVLSPTPAQPMESKMKVWMCWAVQHRAMATSPVLTPSAYHQLQRCLQLQTQKQMDFYTRSPPVGPSQWSVPIRTLFWIDYILFFNKELHFCVYAARYSKASIFQINVTWVKPGWTSTCTSCFYFQLPSIFLSMLLLAASTLQY